MALQNLTAEQLSALKSGNAAKIVTELHDRLETAPDGTKKIAHEFGPYWGLVRFALTAAKVFTPERIDVKIDELIKAGDDADARRLEAEAAANPAPPIAVVIA